MDLDKSHVVLFIILFSYLVMNILLWGMITDHLSDTYALGTNGHTSIGFKTLTTSGVGFPVRDLLSLPSPLWVWLAHTESRVFYYLPLLEYFSMCVVIYNIFIVHMYIFKSLYYSSPKY